MFPTGLEQFEISLRPWEKSTGASYELFSLPFSNYCPEELPEVLNADTIHLHWVSGLVSFRRFFNRISQPIVWTLHDQQPYLGGFHYETDRAANPAMADLESACFKMKQDALKGHQLAVVGNSDWNTNLARESEMFPTGTTFQTIYYPLDTQAYQPRDQTSARIGLGIPSEAFVVGFAATSLQNKRKGLAQLLDALRVLSPVKQPIMLLSFGRSPSADQVESIPHPWVHLGFLDDDRIKALVYSAMDCFVAPSIAEAFGQTAIEALACEVPVIASRTGGLIEAVGDAGILVEPGNRAECHDAILELIQSPILCASLGRKGRARVKDRHDPSKCAAEYASLYRSLM